MKNKRILRILGIAIILMLLFALIPTASRLCHRNLKRNYRHKESEE